MSDWTRRQFVQFLGGTASAALVPGAAFAQDERPRARPEQPGSGAPRPRVAIVATVVRKYSHAQHFIDRFLEGYGWQGEHHYPPMDLVSLYVDQFPEGDLARERSARHNVPIYPTIAEALTQGGDRLAVDAVLIIGEHGDYPRNERGQTLYPRYRFFKEVVAVFEDSGRSVPVFNDKHLSTDWDEAVEMVEDSRRLGFAFLAGSSLPVTWRIPSIEMPLGTPLEESVCVCYGGVDSYDIHGLETAQCMSERREGGESGVRRVHAVRGPRTWDMVAERETTAELVVAALARSHTLTPPEAYTYPPLPPLQSGAALLPPLQRESRLLPPLQRGGKGGSGPGGRTQDAETRRDQAGQEQTGAGCSTTHASEARTPSATSSTTPTDCAPR